MPRGGATVARGRIRPHERDTNDDVPIIGATIAINEDHRLSVQATEGHDRKLKTKEGYRNRIKHIYEFLQEKYPDYCDAGGVVVVLDTSNVFHHKNTYDLKYEGMNVEFVKVFLGQKKNKANGKLQSFNNIRKYRDAILWGAECAKERLPTNFHEEIEKWLNSYRKETRIGARDGRLDESEADPVPFTMFRHWLEWSLEANNLYVWVFALLQWNLMARSISVGTLCFHNFRVGEDNIIIRYDSHKADQAGESCHDKHLFANPLDPVLDLFLALGIWLSIDPTNFSDHEDLFRSDDTLSDAASGRFCTQLNEILKKHHDSVVHYMRPNHANTHSIRKGSGTYSQSGTTCPPPATATAGRGEWSLGRVFDLYLHLDDPADTYLGRILAGLDPLDDKFATLPPHFIPSNPMGNDLIKEAMGLMYGPILQRWGEEPTNANPTGLLLRVLPAVVYHSEFLDTWMREKPGHLFANIPLLQRRDMLSGLKALVTTEPSESMRIATGIPPHIRHSVQMKKMIDVAESTLATVGNLSAEVRSAVEEAYEQRAQANGHMTADRMRHMLDELNASLASRFDALDEKVQRLREMRPSLGNYGTTAVNPHDDDDDDAGEMPFADGDEDNNEPAQSFRLYAHGGKMWHVPAEFVLPTDIPLRTAVRMWLEGMPGYQTADPTRTRDARAAPIRPFRLLQPKLLPLKVKQLYQLHWRPIMELFFAAPGITIPECTTISADELDNVFEVGFDYLKSQRMTYVFKNRRKKPLEWKLATWSRHALPSSIQKGGEALDISNLPPLSSNSRPRKTAKRKRKAKDAATRRQTPRNSGTMQRNTAAAAADDVDCCDDADQSDDTDQSEDDASNQQQSRGHHRRRRRISNTNDTSGAFAAAFGEVEMTEHMTQLDRQILAEGAEERKEDMEAEADYRRRVGDAVGTEGRALWLRHQPDNRVPPNNGNLSTFERLAFQNRLQDLPNNGTDHFIS